MRKLAICISIAMIVVWVPNFAKSMKFYFILSFEVGFWILIIYIS